MSKVIFSGIQPSGNLHIGNYIGAIRQWIKLQEENETIFCVVDLHAITVPQDPKVLREKILEVAALYLACGIDPKKSKIFIQSENPDHTYLSWIFDCILSMGELFRMTQFKDKIQKIYLQKNERVASDNVRSLFEGYVGLFNYPALMAADILLYSTDLVPVGEDQKQHIELTRDIAEKFNRVYGGVFKLPEPLIDKEAARIMSLQVPHSKMSKSDIHPLGSISLLEETSDIISKIKKAVTDSGSNIAYAENRPAVSNLLVIYSKLSGKSIVELENQYEGIGYAKFKEDLIDVIETTLRPIRNKYLEIRSDKEYLSKVLDEGRDYSIEKSSKTLRKVKEVMGIGRS